MRAAVRAGADAVYFGLQGFNARARAKNFDVDELSDTFGMLHEHGTKGYVTLNTLVFDHELDAAVSAIEACARAGADAVIVQDFAVAKLVRAIAPTMPIHASTQMTCTDATSVAFAAELGARRVVLARELSIEQIAEIASRATIELEVFVHGALCVSYSGQCLTSEAIGGRSANRGACAQACRLPYQLVVDGVLRDLGDKAYLLSPMDLEAAHLVPRLAEIGVRSMKIEGRMKGPEYVYAATRLYREAAAAAVGEGDNNQEHRRLALQTYSRGSGAGFLDGVDHQQLVEGMTCDHRGVEIGVSDGLTHIKGGACVDVTLSESVERGDGILVLGAFAGLGEVGGRVWEIYDAHGKLAPRAPVGERSSLWLGPDKSVSAIAKGRRVFRTNDPRANDQIKRDVERAPEKAPLSMRVTGAIGSPLVIEAKSLRDGRSAIARTDVNLETARSAATDQAVLADKLGRLGDTPFTLAALQADLSPNAFIAVGALNRARRELVLALDNAARRSHAITAVDLRALSERPERTPAPAGLFVLCRSLLQARAAVAAGADGIILDFLELTGTGAAVRELRSESSVHITLTPPRVRKPGEEKIDRFLETLNPDALLVRGLGALGESTAIPRVGDFSLNVTNTISAATVLDRGLVAFTPSFDLDAEQLTALLYEGLGPQAEIVVHHPMPLFHNEHCLFAALLSEGRDHRTCGRPCDRHELALRDRAGVEHPVIADVGCRNTVFHARPQSAATMIPNLRDLGVRRFRIELVRENAADVARLVRVYRELVSGQGDAERAWRELRADGGYGVVRGSLRVLS